MLTGTPLYRPVIVRKPRPLCSMKSDRPGAGGSRYSASRRARASDPTDRMRFATSPFCRMEEMRAQARQRGEASNQFRWMVDTPGIPQRLVGVGTALTFVPRW